MPLRSWSALCSNLAWGAAQFASASFATCRLPSRSECSLSNASLLCPLHATPTSLALVQIPITFIRSCFILALCCLFLSGPPGVYVYKNRAALGIFILRDLSSSPLHGEKSKAPQLAFSFFPTICFHLIFVALLSKPLPSNPYYGHNGQIIISHVYTKLFSNSLLFSRLSPQPRMSFSLIFTNSRVQLKSHIAQETFMDPCQHYFSFSCTPETLCENNHCPCYGSICVWFIFAVPNFPVGL